MPAKKNQNKKDEEPLVEDKEKHIEEVDDNNNDDNEDGSDNESDASSDYDGNKPTMKDLISGKYVRYRIINVSSSLISCIGCCISESGRR